LRLEAGVRADAKKLLEVLTSEVNRERRVRLWTSGHLSEALDGALSAAVVTVPPSATPGTLAFAFRGNTRLGHSEGTFEAWFDVRVANGHELTVPGKKTVTLFEATPTGAYGAGAPPRSFLLPPPTIVLPNNQDGGVPLLELQLAATRKRQQFTRAQQGDPTAASGLFLRMLYFSATTITTLGIGDIQPVGEWARIFVTLEAIGGLVLIGLFLNALARRAQETNAARVDWSDDLIRLSMAHRRHDITDEEFSVAKHRILARLG